MRLVAFPNKSCLFASCCAQTNITPSYLQYLDKRLFVQLNGSRKVIGVLRGYDVFLNIVLDEAVEEKDGGEKVRLGMVVSRAHLLRFWRVYAQSLMAIYIRSSAETRS